MEAHANSPLPPLQPQERADGADADSDARIFASVPLLHVYVRHVLFGEPVPLSPAARRSGAYSIGEEDHMFPVHKHNPRSLKEQVGAAETTLRSMIRTWSHLKPHGGADTTASTIIGLWHYLILLARTDETVQVSVDQPLYSQESHEDRAPSGDAAAASDM